MARPPKLLDAQGRPIRRLTERVLTHVDEHGRAHELLLPHEVRSTEFLNCSEDLLVQLTRAGVIRVARSSSLRGPRMYSRQDVMAVRDQLFNGGPPADVAVGLVKPAAK
jgi:hypothetical protein